MLSPSDADLARRDPTLPGLATLLDPEAFAAALRPVLPDASATAVRITYARYKPTQSCVVGYQLRGTGAAVDLYAKAHPVGGASRRAREGSTVPTPPGRGRIILEDGAIVVSVFPTDGKLKPLRRLADPETRRRLVRKLVRDRPDLWSGTVRNLRYMPERRYVGQLLTGDSPAAVLKLYTERGYSMAQRNVNAFRSDGPLRVARCIGQLASFRILLLEWLAGRLLSEAISDPELELPAMLMVGAALAHLHAQEPEGLVCLTREHETATLSSLFANLRFVCPHVASRFGQLFRRLASDLQQSPPVNQPIHGDFCAKQVLLGDNTVAILDFDRSVRSDPAADLGLFIAHLERDALYGTLRASGVERLREALLEGYRAATRRPVPVRVPLYVAVGLVRLAPDPFRYRESDWPERTEAILGRAEALLEGAAADTGGIPPGKFGLLHGD